MNETLQYCPICNAEVKFSSRYPNYLCNSCAEKKTDIRGEKVIFYNTHLMGHGCQGYYLRNDKLEEFPGNVCYVAGIECFASEGYFGGIITRPKPSDKINKELYFEIAAEGGASRIYKVTDDLGEVYFYRFHTNYDVDEDDITEHEEYYGTFEDFLKEFLQMQNWYFLHPLFVHKDLKPAIQTLIENLNLKLKDDPRWINHHRETWKRVLEE